MCVLCGTRVCFVQASSHGPHVVVFSRIGIFIVFGGRSVSSSGEEQQASVLFCLGRAGTARSREMIRCEKEGWLVWVECGLFFGAFCMCFSRIGCFRRHFVGEVGE